MNGRGGREEIDDRFGSSETAEQRSWRRWVDAVVIDGCLGWAHGCAARWWWWDNSRPIDGCHGLMWFGCDGSGLLWCDLVDVDELWLLGVVVVGWFAGLELIEGCHSSCCEAAGICGGDCDYAGKRKKRKKKEKGAKQRKKKYIEHVSGCWLTRTHHAFDLSIPLSRKSLLKKYLTLVHNAIFNNIKNIKEQNSKAFKKYMHVRILFGY